MGLKIRLQWYDMRTELGEGIEFSNDFGDNAEIMTKGLHIPTKNNVNNGFLMLKPNGYPFFSPTSYIK